ncbi:MAG: GNAT family N-acetyltransferase [Eggerthellaceae bacterium]|nr:GNAT family N-acetyltransferase [Eggerthellaceae bacterium]
MTPAADCLRIALATEADLPALAAFYDDMIAATAGTDNDPMWVRGVHPSQAELADAVAAGELLVGWLAEGERERLASALVVNNETLPGHEKVSWRVAAAPDEVAVIHLLAVHPDFAGRGIARRMLAAAHDLARQRGARVMRLEVLVSNKGPQRLYEKVGYTNLGYAKLASKDPRVTDFVMFELQL